MDRLKTTGSHLALISAPGARQFLGATQFAAQGQAAYSEDDLRTRPVVFLGRGNISEMQTSRGILQKIMKKSFWNSPHGSCFKHLQVMNSTQFFDRAEQNIFTTLKLSRLRVTVWEKVGYINAGNQSQITCKQSAVHSFGSYVHLQV